MIKSIATKVITCLPLLFICSVQAESAAQSSSSDDMRTQLLNPSPLSSSIWQMALGLSLVLVVIFVLAWLMRRVTGIQNGKAHIKIVSAINVGTKERAVLVEVGGEQLLLGVANGQVNLLHKLESPVDDQGSDFSNSLKQASIKLSRKNNQAEMNKGE